MKDKIKTKKKVRFCVMTIRYNNKYNHNAVNNFATELYASSSKTEKQIYDKMVKKCCLACRINESENKFSVVMFRVGRLEVAE